MTMHYNQGNDGSDTTRRAFLGVMGTAMLSLALPSRLAASLRRVATPIQLGLIADLHHDIMHDGTERLKCFQKAMAETQPDAIVQMGDFAWPSEKNQPLIDTFNADHPTILHVLGNHDIDGGYSWGEMLKAYGLERRYYAYDISGLRLIVLDGNERSPDYRDVYPAYIGLEQATWLEHELQSHDGPIVVFSHQPIAGPSPIDNAVEIQKILNRAADKVILAVNGHTHIDTVVRVGRIAHLHVNSASYKWVGTAHAHESYSEDIHHQYPSIQYTCPYRDAIFTTLSFDPTNWAIQIQACVSQWVGQSPAELGEENPGLTDGEEIAPRIRYRRIPRVTN